MTKNILFITWDGPQTSYMEGLFMPIFNKVGKIIPVSFHVIQFTWSTTSKTDATKIEAEALGIKYTAFPIWRKPTAVFGSIITLIRGIWFLKKYIQNNNIDVVMPRSTMPSIMVNRMHLKKIKIIFDADGLPLEERVDFSGLSKNSKQFKWLKAEETKMLKKADKVITRSKLAIDFHINTIGELYRDKFSIVYNGRNSNFFKPDIKLRESSRFELKIKKDEKVFIYCGSLGGAKYSITEMILIFKEYLKINKKAKFFILTGNLDIANKSVPNELMNKVIIKCVPFQDVSKYLNVGDVAFALIEPKMSMQAVAAIKLGEYLLMGIPTIASTGIGDSEEIIKEAPDCFLYDHNDENRIQKTVAFLQKPLVGFPTKIREIGLKYFSLEKSAESYINAFKSL